MLPVIDGVIERRLLVNYRVDADVASAMLPRPFRPHLVDGSAVAGICLLRMGSLRPRGLPAALGRRSENAAHRIAVEWDDDSGTRTGVYIARRDSGSWLNVAAGGRVFPGEHGRAKFKVRRNTASAASRLRNRRRQRAGSRGRGADRDLQQPCLPRSRDRLSLLPFGIGRLVGHAPGRGVRRHGAAYGCLVGSTRRCDFGVLVVLRRPGALPRRLRRIGLRAGYARGARELAPPAAAFRRLRPAAWRRCTLPGPRTVSPTCCGHRRPCQMSIRQRSLPARCRKPGAWVTMDGYTQRFGRLRQW